MMRKLFDLIIDTLLFSGDFICHFPSRIVHGYKKIAEGIFYVFKILPFRISLIYRFRKIWYPAKSDFDSVDLTNEMRKWLDDNLGKYRWSVIPRLTHKDGDYNWLCTKYYLCFRYKTDAVAFKLRWTE